MPPSADASATSADTSPAAADGSDAGAAGATRTESAVRDRATGVTVPPPRVAPEAETTTDAGTSTGAGATTSAGTAPGATASDVDGTSGAGVGPVAPAEAAGSTDVAVGLTERERRILDFEQRWWKHAGAKEQAIRDTFGLSATRYYQLLNGLLDNPAALAAEPLLIGRLRRLRSSRARNRRR